VRADGIGVADGLATVGAGALLVHGVRARRG
jgi:hypothetical protein